MANDGRRIRYPGDESIPNCVRFELKDGENEDVLNNAVFVEKILFKELGLTAKEILCIQKNAKMKCFDVTFQTREIYKRMRTAVVNKDGLALKFTLFSMGRDPDYRVMTVRMFNPHVQPETVAEFLKKYCKVLPGLGVQRDEYGIWNGCRQFRVIMEREKGGYDGYRHPPASFSIGESRGVLYYAGQPRYCRKCLGFGHLAEGCTLVRCLNCSKLGHTRRDCPSPERCNICGEEGHGFRTCEKRSYAQAASGGLGTAKNRDPEPEAKRGDEPQPGKQQTEGGINSCTQREDKGEHSTAAASSETAAATQGKRERPKTADELQVGKSPGSAAGSSQQREMGKTSPAGSGQQKETGKVSPAGSGQQRETGKVSPAGSDQHGGKVEERAAGSVQQGRRKAEAGPAPGPETEPMETFGVAEGAGAAPAASAGKRPRSPDEMAEGEKPKIPSTESKDWAECCWDVRSPEANTDPVFPGSAPNERAFLDM